MKKGLEIWQDNALTLARYEMTEAEKNILYMVVANVRKDDIPTKMYQVSVKDMAEITGSEEFKFETYRQATRKLMTRVFETTLPNGNILQATFIASAEYKKGTGIIEIELSQKVRPYYVELNERYTKIQLQSAISLQSVYAKRVYELLCMYKNMQDKSFRRTVIELKTMLGIIDPKTGKDSYPDWTNFKRRVLDVSSNEINGHTDLTFTFEPIYGRKAGRGRKPVEKIQFEVFYSNVVNENQVNPLLDKLIKLFRLRPDQANKVLEIHSVEVINRQLYDIQVKAANKEIKNIGSYTAKIFNVQ